MDNPTTTEPVVRPQPYIPAVIATCLKAATKMAEEGDWETLQVCGQMIAQEARIRALDARADEAGVVGSVAGTLRTLEELGLVFQVERTDGQSGYVITEAGRAVLTNPQT